MSSRGTRFTESFEHRSGDHDASWSHGMGDRDDALPAGCHDHDHDHDRHHHHHHHHHSPPPPSSGGTGSGNGPTTSAGPTPSGESALTAAAQDVATLQAGVQAQAGETNPPNLSNLPAGDDTAGDAIKLTGTHNGTISILGNGKSDAVVVDTGDNNILHTGDGAGDQIIVGTGNENDLRAGNGAGDSLSVGSGNHNVLAVGNGDGDTLSVGAGSFNSLQAGTGNGDQVSVDGGDNNVLTAGDGANDFLTISIVGNHNTLQVGAGDSDVCTVASGDNNLVSAGNGAGDMLLVSSGNSNVLIDGNGANDSAAIGTGDHNVLAVGDGAGDTLQLSSGNDNILLDGNGINDKILAGGVVGTVGTAVNMGNAIVIGNGDGDQAWGSLGDGNNYVTGAGSDLVHTGGGADFVYVDNHAETATASDPTHLTSTDSLAQNLFADGGNDTFALQGTLSGSPSLGTTVMTGGGGVEKYWLANQWGNAVLTDFNSAHGDRVMIGSVSDPSIANLGSVTFQYVHSAYDTVNAGNVDLLITFGGASNHAQSITLIDYKPQDTSNLFNNVTLANPVTAEATLAHIFDFNLTDNQAVTTQIASLASQHLILH